jgi:hypothetical protein
MTKLEKLYSIIENSRDLGVRLNKDVLQQVEELEEGIIKEEILPALSNDIAPRLNPIKRDLVLVVEYHPGKPISVALSRKTNISQLINAKKLVATPSMPHNPNADLIVTFPDGTVFDDNKAIDTFVKTIAKVGFDNVAKVGITFMGYNLVDMRQRTDKGKKWQKQVGKYYIYSYLSNGEKLKCLNKISNYFNLGLKVETK